MKSSKNTSHEPSAATKTLIWIDDTPLIKAEHAKYKAAIGRLNQVQQRLEFHTKSDEPKYTSWLHSEFADELARVRQLHHRYFELELIISSVEEYANSTGSSAIEGYENYLETLALAKQMAETKAAESDDDSAGEPAGDSSDESEDESEDESSAHSSAHSHQHGTRMGDANANRSAKSSTADEAQIKSVYRALARKLHPDINGDLSDHERELWFDVQAAYDDRDLHRLEALLAMTERAAEDGEGRVEKVRSLSRLKAMLQNLARKIRNVQRSLSKAKQSVAWDFHKVKEDPRRLAKLRTSVSLELYHVHEGVDVRVRDFERVIAKWERAVRKRRSRS